MHTYWIIFLAVIGACVGSFLNVVIYRLPRGESIVFPPSHCPRCGRRIRWYDNIPLVSWLALRGRCRFCGSAISPRYLLVEATTAILVAGLYVSYYVLNLRAGAGDFAHSWPTFAAHAALLCGLLACSMVDVEHWVVPLEVCWVVSALGVIVAGAWPGQWMPAVSLPGAAAAVGAALGLVAGLVGLHYGIIRRSFIDVADKPPAPPAKKDKSTGLSSGKQQGKRSGKKSGQKRKGRKARPLAVAVTADDGVNPRCEVLHELLFLLPAIVLALVGWLVVARLPACRQGWSSLISGPAGPHVIGASSALFGYLVGGLWIWGVRILGTLCFGKEAMGLGDVHILAAVGAVTGWIVPSLVFFLAPLFGLLWALYLWLRRNQRELPYGPWLAVATLAVMLFYDPLAKLLRPYADTLRALLLH